MYGNAIVGRNVHSTVVAHESDFLTIFGINNRLYGTRAINPTVGYDFSEKLLLAQPPASETLGPEVGDKIYGYRANVTMYGSTLRLIVYHTRPRI